MCADPSTLEGLNWWLCYLTTVKHMNLYTSVFTVLLLLAIVTPCILALGFGGAVAKRSALMPVRWVGMGYTSMVRGVPDIVFFMFVPIALDQVFEMIRHKVLCSDVTDPIWQGNDFVVCDIAKLPLNAAPQWQHDAYGFILAVIAFAIVFGAFAANVIDGALKAVPKGQLEAGEAVGMTKRQIFTRIHAPQMWRYALPGLSNLWMILLKATPLLFLLGIEDVVYWARELGGAKTSRFAYPHPDWRLGYFLALLVFYLFLTWISEKVFDRLKLRFGAGVAI
ncbi:ABC transporter permease subunit [Paracoccaceae bacterium]|nr:ABC transporter permease subunit [Paracoccaceae bacterium]